MVGAQINDSKGRAYLSLGFPLPISSWVYNSTFHPRQVGNTGQKRAEGPKSSAHTQDSTLNQQSSCAWVPTVIRSS